VQIPTSLLSAVDSSVGGKTGIDHKSGKNLAGAFYQPEIVVFDPDVINTLPEEYFADGMAEVIKYAIIRGRDIDNIAYERCLDKLMLIDRTIRSKLNSRVYLVCRKKKTVNKLKRTNVFRLQKDYKQIYSLVKWFGEANDTNDELHWMTDDGAENHPEYYAMLTVFALGHLDFKFDGRSLDFSEMNARATFHNWNVELTSVSEDEIPGLMLSFSKDRKYRICLIFGSEDSYQRGELDAFKAKHEAEEYKFVSSAEFGTKDTVYLSLFDIDSFRRVQQIALRGMIYSDENHDTCPFCGHETVKDENGCHCKKCRTLIEERICETSGKRYYTSGIFEYRQKSQAGMTRRDKFLHEKFTESQLFFRNITEMTPSGENICPICGKINR
jgi:hypothetical protein